MQKRIGLVEDEESYHQKKEPSPIHDRDTKNKAEEIERLHAAMKEKLVSLQIQKNFKY